MNVSFPLSVITKNSIIKYEKSKGRLKLEKYLYEELQKRNKLEEIQHYCDQNAIPIKIREKTTIEETIEQDDIDNFRILSNSNDFDFNQKIKKVNQQYHYFKIPLILYCIEKNAIKCFKFALLNGADPTQKSERRSTWDSDNNDDILEFNIKTVWDGFGFAGATGNIQIVKLMQEKGLVPTQDLMKGSTKFHQINIINWIQVECNKLLKTGIKQMLHYENYLVFDLLFQNSKNINEMKIQEKTTIEEAIHYALKKNSIDTAKILILKGADINAKDIIHLNMIILFFINII